MLPKSRFVFGRPLFFNLSDGVLDFLFNFSSSFASWFLNKFWKVSFQTNEIRGREVVVKPEIYQPFFKTGFHSVYYIGTMSRFVKVKTCFFLIIHFNIKPDYWEIFFKQELREVWKFPIEIFWNIGAMYIEIRSFWNFGNFYNSFFCLFSFSFFSKVQKVKYLRHL